MSKHDLRIIKTKKQLTDALLQLLTTKPLQQIKVTELCALAYINRGTFYGHYGEVADLFKDIFTQVMTDLTASYEAPYAGQQTIEITKLEPSAIRIFHHVHQYERFYRIIFSESVPIMYYYMLLDELKKNIAQNHTTETFSFTPFSISYQANAILGIVVEWYRQDFRQSIDEMNMILVRFLREHREQRSNK